MSRAVVSLMLFVALASACAAQTPDSLEVRLERGIRAFDEGRRDVAYQVFDSFIDDYNDAGGRLSARQLLAVGVAMRYLGDRDPQLFKDALKAFDEAAAADPRNPTPHIHIGELFLDKYNSAEARRAFDVALGIDPANADALVGLASTLAFDSRPGSLDAARKALRSVPGHAGAHAFLAHSFVAADALDSARIHAELALRAEPASLDALIAMAAVEQAAGRTAALTALRQRVAANSTARSRLAVALAELSVQQRRYAEAVRLAREAVGADSLLWRAWSVLGINQLRLGDDAGARSSLETAFAGDPYNVWLKNTLDMLDRVATFRTRSEGPFNIIASERDAAVVAPYAAALGAQAFARLQQRYGYTPPTPIRLEIFDRHADFSVRSVGLAGLGALGVSFGSVLAMDGPAARERGVFNWGSTLWHELAHAFHLGMTDQRVPRWFTEGLAVLEERRARPGWGEEELPAFMRAARAHRLLPLAELNSGFVRPSYPEQIGVSYYQASLVIEMLEQQFGEATTRALLQAFAQGKSTETALRDVVRKTPLEIDQLFAHFVQQRLSDESRVKAARAASDYEALAAQATTQALESAIYIWPYDIDLHARLAESYARSGNAKEAVRERQVILALAPADLAEARYQLALSYEAAGDNASARKEVLRALEIAPSFDRAQQLLLKLSEKR